MALEYEWLQDHGRQSQVHSLKKMLTRSHLFLIINSPIITILQCHKDTMVNSASLQSTRIAEHVSSIMTSEATFLVITHDTWHIMMICFFLLQYHLSQGRFGKFCNPRLQSTQMPKHFSWITIRSHVPCHLASQMAYAVLLAPTLLITRTFLRVRQPHKPD